PLRGLRARGRFPCLALREYARSGGLIMSDRGSSNGGASSAGSAWRNDGGVQPHAFDPYLQPELFRGVLTRRIFAFLIDLVVLSWVSVSFLTPLVVLVGLFNGRRRLLHDIILGTVIINSSVRTQVAPVARSY